MCCRATLLCRRISPIALGQESRPDPWHHLASCMLCSRTSGSVVVHAAIARFFECFDTPSAVLEADSDALRVIIAPCGLQDSRCNAIKRMSHDFLAMVRDTATATRLVVPVESPAILDFVVHRLSLQC